MAMEQQAAAPAEGAPPSGGDQLGQLIGQLGTGNQMLMEVVQGAGAPPEIMQLADAYMQAYEALTTALGGGGSPAPKGGASQMVAQEQGGAAASQASPAMRGGG